MLLCYLLAGALCFIILLYLCIECNYFLRMCFCVCVAKFCKPKMHILQEASITGVCTTTDVDTLLYHMNNSRYLREIDFARVDFYQRTGLYKAICAKGGAVVQGACTIRYRRFIRPFTMFRITTKIIYWDAKAIFMEHRFITTDEFVRAIAIGKQTLINCNAEAIINDLIMCEFPKGADVEIGKTKPEIPLELVRWMESNEISSANLRNSC